MHTLTWVALAGLVLAHPASARDWYLSPAGNDAGDGSQAQPLRSISRLLDPALALLNPGDRLILRGPAGNAVFREDELRLRLPLTLMAFPGEQPRIECPLNLPDGVCVQIDPDASGSVITGLDISGGNLYTLFFQTEWEQGNPGGRGASNILIENNRLHDSGRDVIKITPKCNNLTIRGNEIYRSGRIYPPGTPLEERNAEGIDNVQGAGMKVQNNHIHDISTNGVYFKGGAMDALVERNLIERVGESGILAGFDTSPEFFDLGQNPQYFEAIRGIVRNNIVRETDFAGIGLYASREVLIANNTLVNTAKLGHAALYFGVTLQDFDPIAGRPANLNPRIVNNLISQASGQGDCLRIRFANELGGLSGLSGAPGTDYNLYHRIGNCRFIDQRPGSVLDDGGNLAAWRQASNADSRSLEAAPGLDTSSRLLAGSAAIDQGAVLAEVSEDIDGQTRAAPFDIGADESGSAGGNGSTPDPVALPISGRFSGSWFNANRAGEGFVLEIGGPANNRSFIASWYTYRNGQQFWLFGSAALAAGATRITVPMIQTRGANFGSAFNAADVVVESWGTVSFSFTGCSALTASYTQTGGESGSLQLQRILSQIDGLPCP